MKSRTLRKHVHLAVSAAIIIPVGLLYGVDPVRLMPEVFGFAAEDLELKNILRAIMGLYWAMGTFWIVGIKVPTYWKSATLSNVLFMGGLALGRLVSTALDGVSGQFLVGMLAELILMAWGLYNLRIWKE